MADTHDTPGSSREDLLSELKRLRRLNTMLNLSEVERKRTHEALIASEERYRQVVENANEGIVVHVDGMIVFANPKASELLGYAPGELLGRPFAEVIHGDDLARVMDAARMYQTGTPGQESLEFRAVARDGGVRWMQARGGAVDWEGRRAALALVSDVTEQKRTQAELAEHRQHLEKLVQQRTEELEDSNRRLAEQAERLEEMNAALKVLIDQRAADRLELEARISSQLGTLVQPYLDKLAEHRDLPEGALALAGIAAFNLREVLSGIESGLAEKLRRLTPREAQVAYMVRQGKASKEIAEALDLGVRSVESHRDAIRSKLGIKGRSINLRTYLLSAE